MFTKGLGRPVIAITSASEYHFKEVVLVEALGRLLCTKGGYSLHIVCFKMVMGYSLHPHGLASFKALLINFGLILVCCHSLTTYPLHNVLYNTLLCFLVAPVIL